jgi:hypothetical protein
LFWQLEVEHPVHAELISKHAKVSAPEGVCQRHVDLTVFSYRIEDSFDFFPAVTVEI